MQIQATNTAKIDLAKIPLFFGVDEAVVGDNLTEWLHFYHDGQTIVVEGEPADSMIVILHGEVAIMSFRHFSRYAASARCHRRAGLPSRGFLQNRQRSRAGHS